MVRKGYCLISFNGNALGENCREPTNFINLSDAPVDERKLRVEVAG